MRASRSRKTKKRLAIKHARIYGVKAKKGTKKGSKKGAKKGKK